MGNGSSEILVLRASATLLLQSQLRRLAKDETHNVFLNNFNFATTKYDKLRIRLLVHVYLPFISETRVFAYSNVLTLWLLEGIHAGRGNVNYFIYLFTCCYDLTRERFMEAKRYEATKKWCEAGRGTRRIEPVHKYGLLNGLGITA